MEEEKELTGPESLELIARMINKAKDDYHDTGVSVLFWGSVITFCSLVTFFNAWLRWDWLDYIWLLTFIAVIPQVLISIRESKTRRHKAYDADMIGGLWISFAIVMFLLSYFVNVYDIPKANSLFIIIYGIPTFASGYARRFKPMIIGAIACWVLAIVSARLVMPYGMLCTAAAAQLAWFIPGLILRRRYLKAKQQHV